MANLFRRRLIPNECIHLKDDRIIYSAPGEIVTKWNTLHPKAEFSHGVSVYCIKEGWKISRFFNSADELCYIYCDIIDTSYDEEKDEYVFTDLLADVIIENDGFVRVVDLDELADACTGKIISSELLALALHRLNNLLTAIYNGSFKEYLKKLDAE